MTHWTTDEHGNRTFTHAGWTVRIYAGDTRIDQILIQGPEAPSWGGDHVVEAHHEGVWVSGEKTGQWSSAPSAFTIPWPILEAIVAARATIAGP